VHSGSGASLVRGWLAGLVLCLVAAGGARAQEQQPGRDLEYAVQDGDDCKILVHRFWPGLDEQVALDRLHSRNPQLGPQPHHLRSGMTLFVPQPDPDAKVTFLKPAVNKRIQRAPDWRAASRGDGLWRLDEVNTLKGAGAELTFRDLSSVALDENALIVIYGDLPQKKEAQKSGALEVLRGDTRLSLSDLRGSRPMGVSTPAAEVSVSGGRSAVGVDEQKTSRVQVFTGSGLVSAQGKTVALGAGQGTRVENGKAPEPAANLPLAPAWRENQPSAAFALKGEAGVTLAWAPVQRAARYRVQIGRDTLLVDRAVDAWAEGANATSTSFQLAPGAYFGRVQAVDERGLSGPAAPLFKLVVVGVRHGGAVEGGVLKGQGELRLHLSGAPSVKIAVDGREPEEIRLPALVALAAPGKHELRVGAGAPGVAAALPVEVRAPKAKITLGPPAAGGLRPLTVSLEDDAGKAVALEQDNGEAPLARLIKASVLVLRDSAGNAIPAIVQGAKLQAQLPAGDSVRVVWSGTVIGEAR
jgi:hypothetical protein